MKNQNSPTQEQLTLIICDHLKDEEERLSREFLDSKCIIGVRYFFLDNLLPLSIAESISDCFPDTSKMRLMDSFREKKYTSKDFDAFHPLMRAITFAVQDPRVVAIVERITGIKQQIPDPSLYAGGLSAMTKGQFLGVHIDNSHEATRQYYRTLNLLYYVTPGWSEESGGSLQLWSNDVKSGITIASKFNRLVVMETHPQSWHSVNAVNVSGVRRCVSNYYFSQHSPTETDYFNVTKFSAPPSQPLRRFALAIDAKLRNLVRLFVPSGLGRKDVYKGK